MFNELGRCWGILVGSHPDVPQKCSTEPLIPDAKVLKQAHLEAKENKKRNKKDKKKSSKKRKKDKKKKESQRPSAQSLEVPDSPPS